MGEVMRRAGAGGGPGPGTPPPDPGRGHTGVRVRQAQVNRINYAVAGAGNECGRHSEEPAGRGRR